jgi:hypothetical protein
MQSTKMMARLAILICLGALCSLPARADSDGSFCISNGYVAYDLRSFQTRGLKASHVFRVVRFGTGHGIYVAGEVTAPDFQVHRMECMKDQVIVWGFDKSYVEYTLDISDPDKLTILESLQTPKGPAPTTRGTTEQLGLSRAQTISLESDDPANIYKLVLARTQKRGKTGLAWRATAELIRLDSQGNITQRLLLYESYHIESPE